MKSFTFSRLPALYFGPGCFLKSVETSLSAVRAREIGIVLGGRSFRASEAWPRLEELLDRLGIGYEAYAVAGEPSPAFVDSTASSLSGRKPDAILAVGGGSVLDAGKAVSAMLREKAPVKDFLEGVGTRSPSGAKVPFIAVPTTAGTGSEATKNAVISRTGPDGFKKSLRHEAFVPDAAIVDPELAVGCPREVTAASGLDAVTQLLEAYVSTGSSPLSDALARDGLSWAGRSFPRVLESGADLEARSGMAYAAYLSGVCLAQAGLGIVHGIASPLGAAREIPHGVVCGTLLSVSLKRTVEKLKDAGEAARGPLEKYARAGMLLSNEDAGSVEGNLELLSGLLDAWTERSGIPRLGAYGLTLDEVAAVASRTAAKNHPVPFTPSEIEALILERL